MSSPPRRQVKTPIRTATGSLKRIHVEQLQHREVHQVDPCRYSGTEYRHSIARVAIEAQLWTLRTGPRDTGVEERRHFHRQPRRIDQPELLRTQHRNAQLEVSGRHATSVQA